LIHVIANMTNQINAITNHLSVPMPFKFTQNLIRATTVKFPVLYLFFFPSFLRLSLSETSSPRAGCRRELVFVSPQRMPRRSPVGGATNVEEGRRHTRGRRHDGPAAEAYHLSLSFLGWFHCDLAPARVMVAGKSKGRGDATEAQE
jgi:hypothetical protein